ncbi:MAG: Rap1a/Tai family immunity protein [Pseudomonadota bacterium]
MLLLAIALVMPASYGQAASQFPRMTGQHLVKFLGNVDSRNVHWSPDSPFRSKIIDAEYLDLINREFVSGYIQAVHDSSEGKSWCWQEYKPKPDELAADARHVQQRMTDDQLKKNAADLIVEVWSKKFPCPAATQPREK